jgi:hypothetical protein
MRRPIGVKSILDRLGWSLGFLSTETAAGAMLPSALSRSDSYSLGACWAFSFQPVLLSVWRPAILLLQSGTRARRLTQSPELGFRLLIFLSQRCFCFYAASTIDRRWLLCNGSYASPLTHR